MAERPDIRRAIAFLNVVIPIWFIIAVVTCVLAYGADSWPLLAIFAVEAAVLVAAGILWWKLCGHAEQEEMTPTVDQRIRNSENELRRRTAEFRAGLPQGPGPLTGWDYTDWFDRSIAWRYPVAEQGPVKRLAAEQVPVEAHRMHSPQEAEPVLSDVIWDEPESFDEHRDLDADCRCSQCAPMIHRKWEAKGR